MFCSKGENVFYEREGRQKYPVGKDGFSEIKGDSHMQEEIVFSLRQ